MARDKVGRCEDQVQWWKKVVSLYDIKWKEGVCASDCVIWCAPHPPPWSDALRPEYGVRSLQPVPSISIRNFEECLSDVKVQVFDYSICVQVVSADAYVLDVVFCYVTVGTFTRCGLNCSPRH